VKILTSKPRHDNSVNILILKVFCQQTHQDKAFIELVLGAAKYGCLLLRFENQFNFRLSSEIAKMNLQL
jgi:hypothetical protein